MTQVFKDDGAVIPVTAVLAEPNVITQIRTLEKDGYSAVQIGLGESKKLKKPNQGHLKNLPLVKDLKEFRLLNESAGDLKRGDKITVSAFSLGDEVGVTGVSKGKGFQGVVKRHGFHGSPATHGHKDQERMPGSIGAGGVQRVFKGMRMAGRMGGEQVTVKGLEIMEIDREKNILYIKGALPGSRNSLVMIFGGGEMLLNSAPIIEEVKEVPVTEKIKVEETETTEEIPAEEIKAE